jgi:hypothetical protein
MARPRLSGALTWQKFEAAVLAVFEEGVCRLASRATLPRSEEPINFELYGMCVDVHWELLRAKRSLPFVIEFDSTNQPVLDDVVRSRRLKKRPDFACAMTNPQSPDPRQSQIRYSLECKRLGAAEAKWILNENYSENGLLRFVKQDHAYAKGCESAAMIGYLQNMEPDDVLHEVNRGTSQRKLPSLKKAATGWIAKRVTRLSQEPMVREFDPVSITIQHIWVDLRHCAFEIAKSPQPDDGKTRRAARTAAATKRKPAR